MLLNTDGDTCSWDSNHQLVSRQLDIVFHEAGHACHRLADEYHYSEGNTFLTDPDVSKVEWYVDGDLQPSDGALFEPSDLMAGSYELTAIVYNEVLSYANSDNASPHLLGRVRQGGEKLKDTLAWNLKLTEIFTTSIQGELDGLAKSLTVELTGNTLEIISPLFKKMNHNITLYNTKSLDRSGVKRLDISQYPMGIYYLMIQGFKEPIVRKVSIMR